MGEHVTYEPGQIWEVTYPYNVVAPYLVRLLELDHSPCEDVQLWRIEVVMGLPKAPSGEDYFPESRFGNTSRFGRGPLCEMEVLAWAASSSV